MTMTAISDANIITSANSPSRVFIKDMTPGLAWVNILLLTFRRSSHLLSELHMRTIHNSSMTHNQKAAAIMYAPTFCRPVPSRLTRGIHSINTAGITANRTDIRKYRLICVFKNAGLLILSPSTQLFLSFR